MQRIRVPHFSGREREHRDKIAWTLENKEEEKLGRKEREGEAEHTPPTVRTPVMAQALLARAPLLNNSVGCTKVRKFGVFRCPLSLASSFTQGSCCHAYNINAHKRKVGSRTMSLAIRCEQSSNESQGASVWLGRLAMVGFATAITIEISTGKGLLENIGLATPQYTLAFFVTALVVGLVALFIFQSSSRD